MAEFVENCSKINDKKTLTKMGVLKQAIFSKKAFELFLISFIALYIELLLIRWISSEIRIFAYFKNIVLISSFLGLGLGCALSEKIKINWSISFFVLFLITSFSSTFGLTYIVFVDTKKFYLFCNNLVQPELGTASIIFALMVIIIIYFVSVKAFFTLGLKLGELINEFKPIIGYTINIAGSIAGLLLFSLLSLLWLPPIIWLIIAMIGLFYFYRKIALSIAIVIILVFFNSILLKKSHIIWSSYYKLELFPRILSGSNYQDYALLTNNDIFQVALDSNKLDKNLYRSTHYSFIYELTDNKPDNVLIVGSGMGNDIDSALKAGARYVDAVEIDPAVVYLGDKYHPQKPYSSPKVRTHIEDARTYFKTTNKKYDFIIFGTLDSHMVLSSLSSIRLDNFVYTYESIKEAYQLLNDNGVFAITFFSSSDWLCERIYKTLKLASGKDPIVLTSSTGMYFDHFTFLVGPVNKKRLNKMQSKLIDISTNKYKNSSITLTTDNWPFLFLEKPSIPIHYILPLIILIFLSGLLILYLLGKSNNGFDLHMFFLGAGFMLLEVKAIAKASLIFGSTWIVNSVIITTILILILFANILIYYYPKINFKWIYILLLIAIFVDYITPADLLAGTNIIFKIGITSLLFCLPVFFAAIIFATSFSKVNKPHLALGSNLFGAMVGGSLEYLSMLTGIKFLSFVIMLFYALCFLTVNKKPVQISLKSPFNKLSD